MFAIPGIVLLVAAIYARPQEVFTSLANVPLLYVAFGLAVFGLVLDLRLGITRLRWSPLDPWVFGFLLWATFTALIRSPGSVPAQALELSVCAALYLLIAHGVQTFRGLGIVAGSVLAMVVLVSVVAVEQKLEPTGCIQIDETVPGDTTTGKHDGRWCNVARDCYLGDAEPGAQYMCEHVGWFGTTTVGKGRIRYRGVLQDPNELALAAGVGLPLAFALGFARRRTLGGRALLAAVFVLVLVCAMLTRSRGGQLVFVAVLAVPFARRFGVRGLVLGALLATPLLFLGGRAGGEAQTSSVERADCWAEALSIWRAHPLLGAGLGQFGRYHYLTAHNSYLLALAELGFPGMLLFSGLVYTSAKIPYLAWRRTEDEESPQAADGAVQLVRPWSMALLAAFAGLSVGIFFLSFAYHYVFWIFVGLSGAFAAAIRRHDPDESHHFGWRDLGIVVAGSVAMIGTVWLYTRSVL